MYSNLEYTVFPNAFLAIFYDSIRCVVLDMKYLDGQTYMTLPLFTLRIHAGSSS